MSSNEKINDTDPAGSNGTRASSSITNDKPHPSEYLEFASVPGGGGGQGGRLQPLKIGQPTVEFESSTPAGINPTQSNDDLYAGLSQAIPNLRRLSIEARAAAKAEHKMGFFQGCRLYPKAIMWSAMLSLTIVMEGEFWTCLAYNLAVEMSTDSY